MKKRRKKKRFYQVDPSEEAKQAIERVNKLGRLLGAHPRSDQLINPTFGTALYRCDENDNPVRTRPDFWDVYFAPGQTEIEKVRAARVAEIESNHLKR
jgi:hypothetical protein